MADSIVSPASELPLQSLTVEHRLSHLEGMLAANVRLFDERDRRYEQRFEAQEKAVDTAMVAAEKAVNAALAAAKEAVNKAEISQDKRNLEQNEFRGQLKDQAATLMPRAEYETNHAQVRELIEINRNVTDGLRQEILKLAGRQSYDDRRETLSTPRLALAITAFIGVSAIVCSIVLAIAFHH
jgi:hypothetical protein